MLIPAEVSAREAVVLSVIFNFMHFWDFWELFGFVPGGCGVFLPQGEHYRRPWSSLDSEGSLELQNGGLNGLEEVCIIICRLRHCRVKFGRVLCFLGV